MAGEQDRGPGEAWEEQVVKSVEAWRAQHPRATLAEIEAAVETRLATLRAQLIEAAASSRAAEAPAAEQPACPHCAAPLQARGERERRLQVPGGQEVRLRRPYLVCPACGAGLFPPG